MECFTSSRRLRSHPQAGNCRSVFPPRFLPRNESHRSRKGRQDQADQPLTMSSHARNRSRTVTWPCVTRESSCFRLAPSLLSGYRLDEYVKCSNDDDNNNDDDDDDDGDDDTHGMRVHHPLTTKRRDQGARSLASLVRATIIVCIYVR